MVAEKLKPFSSEIAVAVVRILLMVCLHVANVRVGIFLTDLGKSHARSCEEISHVGR